MDKVSWLIGLAAAHQFWVYGAIFLLATAEGPILSMIFGVVLRLGYFDFLPVYAALMVGDLFGDSLWYFVGNKFGRRFVGRFGKYFSVTNIEIEKITNVFHKFKYRILFLSKISNGFGMSLVVLITAGMVKIPFVKYLATNLTGQFLWTGMLLGVGYFFGDAYIEVDTWFGRISIIAFFAAVVYIFTRYKKYLRGRVEASAQ